MRRHKLKTWPGPFADMLRGDKTFEVRVNDRGFAIGDHLVLHELVPDADGCWDYTDRCLTFIVTYILQGAFGLPENLCVMAVLRVKKP